MPRFNRANLGDGIFHVYARGNRRQKIFECDRDYFMYLSLLAQAVKKYGWRCYAYCLMPNHVHLVVECGNASLSEGMQWLHGTYAQWFNRQHRVDGHLFQDRYGVRLVDTEEHWLETPRYVVLNPLRGGLCDDPSGWSWSSFNATAGTAPAPAFLDVERVLAEFSRNETSARKAYVRYVYDGIGACPGTGLAVRAPVAAAR